MIAIIDYKAGNLTSVARAIAHLGHEVEVTHDLERIGQAERIIFPGVGAAGAAMDNLRQLGLDGALRTAMTDKKPILGICLGTQIIFSFSEEDGGVPCLGLLPGRVKKFPDSLFEDGQRLKIPHMGWNRVSFQGEHPVFSGLDPKFEYYFVHAYYPEMEQGAEAIIAGTTQYGFPFTSAVARENLVAVQFHPEKSGLGGLRILENFCQWRPAC
jgi:glutamine amidotransferase